MLLIRNTNNCFHICRQEMILVVVQIQESMLSVDLDAIVVIVMLNKYLAYKI